MLYFTAQKNETNDDEENEANESSAKLIEPIESTKGDAEWKGECNCNCKLWSREKTAKLLIQLGEFIISITIYDLFVTM